MIAPARLPGRRADGSGPAVRHAGLQGGQHLLPAGPELRQGEAARAGQHAGRQGGLLRLQPRSGPASLSPCSSTCSRSASTSRSRVRPRRPERRRSPPAVSRSTSRTRVGTRTIRIRPTSSTCCSTAAGSRPRTTSTRRTSRGTASPTSPEAGCGLRGLGLAAARPCTGHSTATSWRTAPRRRRTSPATTRRFFEPVGWLRRVQRAGGDDPHQHLQEVTTARTGEGRLRAPLAPYRSRGRKLPHPCSTTSSGDCCGRWCSSSPSRWSRT